MVLFPYLQGSFVTVNCWVFGHRHVIVMFIVIEETA